MRVWIPRLSQPSDLDVLMRSVRQPYRPRLPLTVDFVVGVVAAVSIWLTCLEVLSAERTVSVWLSVLFRCCSRSDAGHLETPPALRSVVSWSDALAHVFGLRWPGCCVRRSGCCAHRSGCCARWSCQNLDLTLEVVGSSV